MGFASHGVHGSVTPWYKAQRGELGLVSALKGLLCAVFSHLVPDTSLCACSAPSTGKYARGPREGPFLGDAEVASVLSATGALALLCAGPQNIFLVWGSHLAVLRLYTQESLVVGLEDCMGCRRLNVDQPCRRQGPSLLYRINPGPT